MFPLISDQLNHYPSKALYVRHPNSKPEFVFGLVKPQGSTAGNPTKISPADLLFFNRQILPQSLRPHLNKSQVLGQVGLKELLPPPHRRTSTISSSTRRLNDNEFCSTNLQKYKTMKSGTKETSLLIRKFSTHLVPHEEAVMPLSHLGPWKYRHYKRKIKHHSFVTYISLLLSKCFYYLHIDDFAWLMFLLIKTEFSLRLLSTCQSLKPNETK